MVRANDSSVSLYGRSRSMGFPHLPHLGRSAARAASMRFHVPQNWHGSVRVRAGAAVVVSVGEVIGHILVRPGYDLFKARTGRTPEGESGCEACASGAGLIYFVALPNTWGR